MSACMHPPGTKIKIKIINIRIISIKTINIKVIILIVYKYALHRI